MNDSFVVPSASVRCVVSAEAGSPNLICRHMPARLAKHDVVFYRDRILVFQGPDKVVYSGKP